MSRSRILAFVVTGLLLAMACVLVYNACDLHDNQPFGVDPELPLFLLGSMLLLSIGVAVLIARLLSSALAILEVLSLRSPRASSQRPVAAFDIHRLLFSPPRTIDSLRI